MKSNPIPILITLLIAGAGIYWYVSSGKGNELPLIAITGSEQQAQTRFQTLVSEMAHISFDTAIFSDPRFGALVDLTTPIAPESIGRLDPFAAVSNSVSAVPTGTSTSAKTR